MDTWAEMEKKLWRAERPLLWLPQLYASQTSWNQTYSGNEGGNVFEYGVSLEVMIFAAFLKSSPLETFFSGTVNAGSHRGDLEPI